VDPDFAWASVNQLGNQTGLHPFGAGDPSIVEIRPEDSGPIALTMSSATVDDVLLGLYDAAGNRVAYGIGLGGEAATISYPGSGAAVYYVYSSSYDGSQSGNYSLAIDAPSFPFTADVVVNPITGGGSYTSGLISPKSDQDFFRITAPANASGLTVTMAPDAGSPLKPSVRLYDTNGIRLAAADAFSGAAQFTYADVTAGATYVIGAGGNWYSGGAFDLDVAFDLYDVPLTAPALEYHGPVSLQGDREITEVHINSTSDYDTWRFASRAGGATTFTATAAVGINPLLALYDGSGQLVAVGESSSGITETLIYSLGAQEVYTVLVQDAERDAIGNVDVTIDAPPASAAAVALDAAGKGSHAGTLAHGSDPTRAEPDYFQFDLPVSTVGDVVITVEPQQAFRLEYQLFASGGAPVGELVTSPADGAAAVGKYSSLIPGESYHLCVFAWQYGDHPAGGDYSLEVAAEVVPGDFDGNGDVDAFDIDKMFGEIQAVSGDPSKGRPAYDLNGDGAVTSADADMLIRAPAFLNTHYGDFNLDGAVDRSDFQVLAAGFGQHDMGWSGGDSNGDGVANFRDYLLLKANLGKGVPTPPSAGSGEVSLAAAEIEVTGSPSATPTGPAPTQKSALLEPDALAAARVIYYEITPKDASTPLTAHPVSTGYAAPEAGSPRQHVPPAFTDPLLSSPDPVSVVAAESAETDEPKIDADPGTAVHALDAELADILAIPGLAIPATCGL
ncbi:MAG: dockerin type I domain-containing protein, partial [Phycisphaerae bacterium]